MASIEYKRINNDFNKESIRHKAYRAICNYCDENIVAPNLRKNGGTLNYIEIIYPTDFMIVAYNEEREIVGFNAIMDYDKFYCVHQIAIRNEYKKQGIGTNMMNTLIEIAKEDKKDIVANVMYYNVASQRMFEKLGFTFNRKGKFKKDHLCQLSYDEMMKKSISSLKK